jgi:hypothetical protein
MMDMKRITLATLALGLAAAPAVAQESLAAPCGNPGLPQTAQETCYAVAQAAVSAQPQLGILIASGNPTLGTASTGGIHLGILPRASLSVRVNGVFVRLPEIIASQAGGSTKALNDRLGVPAPALGANASIGVFPGVSVAPTIGGVGAIDLVGSATWLPLRIGSKRFGGSSTSYGGGVRVGLLRESFTTPGISITETYRKLGTVDFGSVCTGGESPAGPSTSFCTGGGNPGEIHFDLTNWSTRAAISKRLLGLGLTGGIGYDRFSSDVSYAVRYDDPTAPATGNGSTRIYRPAGSKLTSSRLSAFADGSLTILVGTLAAEAGWMRGGDPIAGYQQGSGGFDPKKGTFFGSVGFRLSL